MTPSEGGIDAGAFAGEQNSMTFPRLGLSGTHERFPKALRYVKLNHLCHDPLLDRVNLCGRGSKQFQVQEVDHPQEIEKTEEEGR
jgi:hypothetical protein